MTELIHEEETFAIRGAVFEVCKEMGCGLLVNFGSYPKAEIERMIL